MCSLSARVLDCGDRERSPSTGGYSDDHVVPARLSFRHLTLAEFTGVLVCFYRRGQGRGSAGHDELYCPRINVKRGWTLCRIERRNASAGARADVDESSAPLQGICDQTDSARDLREGTPHCVHHLGVLGVDDADYFQRRLQIQVSRSTVWLLGSEPAKILSRLIRSSLQSTFS